ncbi:unnamed protein product, partial [Heterosigma akashiwo]
VLGLEGKRVATASCSYYHSAVATGRREVYSFRHQRLENQLGHGTRRTRKVLGEENLGSIGPVSLACGQYHTVVGCAGGELLACGKNDSPAGRREHRAQAGAPPQTGLPAPSGCHLLGYYHTLVLTADGSVWAFGRNDYGQLGLGHITQRVGGLVGPCLLCITRLAAGCYHSVLVARNGMLWAFGGESNNLLNNHGQLGNGDTNERHPP